MKPLKYILFSCLAVFALLYFSACSTQKNTPVTRAYHNITSRFNGYFYSNESMKEGVAKMEQAYKYEYDKFLPVFIYPGEKDLKNIVSEMEKSIKKSTLVIQRHTITDRKKVEIPGANKWIDDNYILVGQGQFYKYDLLGALETFEFAAKQYKKFPSRLTALFWMGRTYTELGNYPQATAMLDALRNAKDLPKDLNDEVAALAADIAMRTNNYPVALTELQKAYLYNKSKRAKARYAFLISQLYQQKKDASNAVKWLDVCLSQKPNYDMVFNARISRARLFRANQSERETTRRVLVRMIKDAKNIEYRDQIYYTLADLEREDKHPELEIDYLKKSLAASINNQTQKGLSYLRLADIYFDSQKYPPSQSYYDSALAVIPKTYPDYEKLDTKRKLLSELVKNLLTISTEDSLQRVAAMNESQRDLFIDKLILSYKKELQKKQDDSLANLNNPFLSVNQNSNVGGNAATPGAWYFYNPTTVSFGANEFRKRYGNRLLEDNWRRSSKEVIMTTTADLTETSQDTTGGKASTLVTDKTSRAYYLQGLPLSPKAIETSNKKIVEAYNRLGAIYKEELNNPEKAIEVLEEMLKRFPGNKFEASVMYQLYRANLTLKNNAAADKYKNQLTAKYPDSEYAKLALNPEYKKDIQASDDLVLATYTEALNVYNQKRYTETLEACKKAEAELGSNKYSARFAFLKAMAIGATQGRQAFESELKQITIKYPNDPIKQTAQEYLSMLKNEGATAADTTALKGYTTALQSEYQFIVSIDDPSLNLSKFKIALSNINNANFSSDSLTISNLLLNPKKTFIIVKSFPDKDKANAYYRFLINDPDIFNELSKTTYQAFYITNDNFKVLFKNKDIKEYLDFFYKEYTQP